MDPATHALTSFALVRGFFPRQSWRFVLGVVLAGTFADLDLLTSLAGADIYLSGRFTFTHSILGTGLLVAFAAGLAWKLGAAKASKLGSLLLATSLAAAVHILMDLGTSVGVELLWPLRQTRFAWDCWPTTDPWILALLLAGILLPELFGLVGSEIGAKDKGPRGRNGAIVALALLITYAGARATLHGNAVAQLDAHTYRGESPRRMAAFPETLSMLAWHGVIETATQICTASVPATEPSHFDPESAVCVHKPEESPALTAAQQMDATKRFLQAARFPRANVGATEDGTEVVVRDMRDAAEEETRLALAARVLLDHHGRVTSQRIVWASGVHLR